MIIIALPDEFVKKVNFIADVFERDNGFRPCDVELICAAISACYDCVVFHPVIKYGII